MNGIVKNAAGVLAGLSLIVAGCGGTRGVAPLSAESGNASFADLKAMPGEAVAARGAADDAGAPPQAAVPSASALQASGPSASRRLIITTGTIAVEVSSYAEAAATVTTTASELGGFISGSEANVGEEGRRHGTITLRIPAERWGQLLEKVRGLGKVLREASNGLDVTEEFVDIESRLRAQRRLETELLELMESARRGGLRDLLEIEREVARVRGEIESMEGRRRYLADQSALSTLTVELREPAALVSVEPGALDPIFEAMGEAVSLASKSLGAIIVFVAVLLPWLGAAWVLFLIARWWWRRRK